MEELSTSLNLVFVAVALFRLCVFRSIGLLYVLFKENRKLCVNFSKIKFIVLFSYNSYAFEKRFGSIN